MKLDLLIFPHATARNSCLQGIVRAVGLVEYHYSPHRIGRCLAMPLDSLDNSLHLLNNCLLVKRLDFLSHHRPRIRRSPLICLPPRSGCRSPSDIDDHPITNA